MLANQGTTVYKNFRLLNYRVSDQFTQDNIVTKHFLLTLNPVLLEHSKK
jgi:hypothetical protein